MTPYDPHARISLGDSIIDSWSPDCRIEGVEVELATNEASQAELRFFDPDPEFRLLQSLTSADGIAELPVRVWLGFGEANGLGGPVFEGLLARVERDFSTTILRCFDAGFKMRKVQRTEYHRNLTDLEIIARLAKRNGLRFEGPDERIALDKHKSEKQEGETDWAFAMKCAERAGLVLYVRGDTLFAKEAVKTGREVIVLKFREDFMLMDDFRLSYRVPENQEGTPARVETRGRGRGGRRLKGESQRERRGTELLELKRDLRVKSQRHADRRAEARKALQREHAFDCSVGVLPSFTGPRPDARSTVKLDKLGTLFSGKYLCDRVTHIFAPGELTMELDLYRDVKPRA